MKRWILMAACAAVVFSIFGCNKDEETTTPPDKSTEAPKTEGMTTPSTEGGGSTN